jgi:tetratricopeptide (TPR) repeat protein
MKNINLKIMAVMIVTALAFTGCGLNKMVRNYDEMIKYTPKMNPLEAHGGEIAVEFDGRVSEKYFHRSAKIELTPVLRYNGIEKELGIIYLRGEKTEGEGQVINQGAPSNFSFSELVPFEEGMENMELVIKGSLYKAGKEDKRTELPVREGVAFGTITTPLLLEKDEDLSIAPHGYELETIITKKASLYFAYMKHNLDWKLGLNQTEKAKTAIADLNTFLKQGWKLKSVSLNAWASPEGEVAYNDKLSSDRAKTADKYIADILKKEYKAEKIVVASEAKGEDFEGFMALLNASEIKDKQAIANVINSQLSPAERERKIKDMTIIFAEIEQMLAPLRRAEIVVEAFEPKKSKEIIAELSTTDPAKLNVKELLYAATLTEDVKTKKAIYKSATELYPEDYRGFNNLAYVCLKAGNAKDAAVALEKANQLEPNNGYVLNNLGVIAAWNGDYDNAKSYYEAAQGKGVRTNYNIGHLMIIKGDYQAAISSYAGRTCTFNIALAHMLNQNLTAATTNIDCAPKTAKSHYLAAIIGARRDLSNMLYDNLKKAIELDSTFKEKAAKDLEFYKFFDQAEFQDIVK